MENENNHGWAGWIIGIIIVISLFLLMGGLGKYEGQTAEEWFNAYDAESARAEELENKISDFETALQEANDNIEEANSQISDAQGYAWESYEEMGETLNNLSTVDTVSEP